MASTNKIAIIGGRISSLACAMKLAEMGIAVYIYSPQPVERYAPTGSEGLTVTEDAVDIVRLLAHLGAPFNRTSGGKIDFEEADGNMRTAHAGDETGWHIHRVLCDQARRWETSGLINKRDYREVVDFILDDGVCKGIVSLDLKSMDVAADQYDAVVIGVANPISVFEEDAGVDDDYGPMVLAYQKGARWINPHDKLHSGLQVDGNYHTEIKGLYAVGECAYTSLERNLFTNISSGFACAKSVGEFAGNEIQPKSELASELLESCRETSRTKLFAFWNGEIPPTPDESLQPTAYGLYRELVELMWYARETHTSSDSLDQAERILDEKIIPAYDKLMPTDRTQYANDEVVSVHRLGLLVPISELVIESWKKETKR
jgi:succinate dehydrogenase/fumarate reductase flavoprotein subunit